MRLFWFYNNRIVSYFVYNLFVLVDEDIGYKWEKGQCNVMYIRICRSWAPISNIIFQAVEESDGGIGVDIVFLA